MRTANAIVLGLALGLAAGCTEEVREDEHRQLILKVRGTDEAYDALSNALMQRFESIDPEFTNKKEGKVTTVWRQAEEPNRLTRKRALGSVTGPADGGEAVVTVKVERQVSTKKTGYGELDRQKPAWVGGEDTSDATLEKEILLAVEKRMGGKVIKGGE